MRVSLSAGVTGSYIAATSAAAAHAAALAHSFLILKPEEFIKLVNRLGRNSVVVLVVKKTGIVNRREVYIYAARYGGFTVLTRTLKPLPLPSGIELVTAEDIVLPVAVKNKLDSIK